MRRVVLKLSGEVFGGSRGMGIDDSFLEGLAKIIKKIKGTEIAIVIGAGNFWRGRQTDSMNKAYADHMGMLATIMNSIALGDALDSACVPNSHYTAFTVEGIGKRYSVAAARESLKKGDVVIISGGTGSPFFTTDSGAALRACELGAQEILMAKKVDGVYDKDPSDHPDAVKFDKISFEEIYKRNLNVIDLTAATMCMQNNVGLRVFSLEDPENIIKAARGEDIGTLVYTGGLDV